MFRYLKPPATAGDFATCHVTLFGWRNGGRAGTFQEQTPNVIEVDRAATSCTHHV